MNDWVHHFFITSTFTFLMSTFWLKSAGNFVCFSSFASTLVAIMDDDLNGSRFREMVDGRRWRSVGKNGNYINEWVRVVLSSKSEEARGEISTINSYVKANSSLATRPSICCDVLSFLLPC